MGERRQALRFPFEAKVEVEAGSGKRAGTLRNISAGGAFIVTDEPPPEDSQVRVFIEAGAERLALDANVLQCLPGLGMHLEFVDPAAEEGEKLGQLLAALEGT
jgi:PilZ domain